VIRNLSVVVVGTALAVAGCSGSDGTKTPPELDRIDGPAQVDPSFDPMQVDTSAPAATEPG
jgi:hypothetical protein